MSNDEWTVVSKHDKKRVSRRRRGPGRARDTTEDFDAVEAKELHNKISECASLIASTAFHNNLIQKLCQVEAGVEEIVCYGIGNFSNRRYSGPFWQLVSALTVRKYFRKTKESDIPMVYFDPLTTDLERQVLNELNIEVLKQNERGKRIVDKKTLFFMPHCPKGLYENVLWASWDSLMSHKIYILGNSFRTYVERAETHGCLELVQPFLEETVISHSKADASRMPGQFEAAFNDIFWTQFSPEKDGSTDSFPQRPAGPSEFDQDEVI